MWHIHVFENGNKYTPCMALMKSKFVVTLACDQKRNYAQRRSQGTWSMPFQKLWIHQGRTGRTSLWVMVWAMQDKEEKEQVVLTHERVSL
jgi:hypothetical protein